MNARESPGPSNNFPLFQATTYFYLQPRGIHKTSTPCIPPVLKESVELTISALCVHILHVCASIINNLVVRKVESNLIYFARFLTFQCYQKCIVVLPVFDAYSVSQALVRTESW